MPTRIGNVKVTQKDIIKNWWKLNRYQDAQTFSISPSVSPPEEHGFYWQDVTLNTEGSINGSKNLPIVDNIFELFVTNIDYLGNDCYQWIIDNAVGGNMIVIYDEEDPSVRMDGYIISFTDFNNFANPWVQFQIRINSNSGLTFQSPPKSYMFYFNNN